VWNLLVTFAVTVAGCLAGNVGGHQAFDLIDAEQGPAWERSAALAFDLVASEQVLADGVDFHGAWLAIIEEGYAVSVVDCFDERVRDFKFAVEMTYGWVEIVKVEFFGR